MKPDAKLSEPLKIWLSVEMLNDLLRLAHRLDRKPSELARVVLADFMYGTLRRTSADEQGASRGE